MGLGSLFLRIRAHEQVEKVEYEGKQEGYLPRKPRVEIRLKFIDYNGENFFYATHVIHISEYEGAQLVNELPVKHLSPDSQLYSDLMKRGRKFVALKRVHYMNLHGMFVIKRRTHTGDTQDVPCYVRSRVMTD